VIPQLQVRSATNGSGVQVNGGAGQNAGRDVNDNDQTNNGDGPVNNTGTVFNAAPVEPVRHGIAQITDVRSVDGKPRLSTDSVISVDVSELPDTRDTRLFLVCKPVYPDPSDEYFVKAEVTSEGPRAYPVLFGGHSWNDAKRMVNSVRTCSVAAVNAQAGNALADAIAPDADEKLPEGAELVSEPKAITIQRVPGGTLAAASVQSPQPTASAAGE
jgi:hypothetical protein